MKIQLDSRQRGKRPPRLALEQLRDPEIRERFCAEVSTNLPQHTCDLNALWEGTVNTVLTAVKKCVPTTKRPRNDWISPQTLQLVNARRNANSSARRRELTELIKGSIAQDKERYWQTTADQMNIANTHGNTGKLFRTIKAAVGTKPVSSDTVRENDGSPIQGTQRKLDRWREHFDALLNRPAPSTPLFRLKRRGTMSVSDEPPNLEEVQKAVRSMRSKSAPGEDGITAEMLKAAGQPMLHHLTMMVREIWCQKFFPSRWKTAVLIPIYKKGDKTVCKNYRGISLIDVAYKTVEAIILARIRPATEQFLRENQGGFRPGRSTADQIFALRQIIELRKEFKRPLFATFVDFKAAFDSVDRSRMYEILRTSLGLPVKIVELIREMYCGSTNVVRVGSNVTADFQVVTGVKQGALLSPVLFNVALDETIRAAMVGCDGIWLDRNGGLTDLDYADDLVVLAESHTEMQRMIDRLDACASAVGLVISKEKTQTMRLLDGPEGPITLKGSPLAMVSQFCYLGSTITMDGSSEAEIQSRIAKASSAFDKLNERLWSVPEIQLSTKLRVYFASIRPVLLYACETWPMKIEEERRLQAFEFRCWRRLLNISYEDHVSNDAVASKIRPPTLCTTALQKRRLDYLGHLLRRSDSFLPKRALLATPPADWKRPPGGVRNSWQRTVQRDLSSLAMQRVYRTWNKDWKNILMDICADRQQWSLMVSNAIAGDGVASTGRR
jgi:hypothetical protein